MGAWLPSLEVQTEEHRRAAAALPEGVTKPQGRFSLSPAAPEIMAELERLLKAERTLVDARELTIAVIAMPGEDLSTPILVKPRLRPSITGLRVQEG